MAEVCPVVTCTLLMIGGVASASCTKVAVVLIDWVNVNAIGFVVPDRSPLQPSKAQPASGTAVSVRLSPDKYEAWSGSRLTPPLPTTLIDTSTPVDAPSSGSIGYAALKK